MTIITEIEAVINSRPYVDPDINSSQILMPGHFLSLNYQTGFTNINTDDCNGFSTSSQLIQIWKSGQNQLDNFWKKWVNQYLQILRERKSIKMKPVKGQVTLLLPY